MVSPQSQTTPVGLCAVFECQHATAGIIWRVNGESVGGNATHIPSAYVTNSGSIAYTLSIRAEPEFNNSVVECEAVDRNERSYAKLSVQG